MFPINDLLDAVLLGSFFFGLIFVVLSVLLGSIGIGGDGHGHGAGDGAGTDHPGSQHGVLGFLNVNSLLAFVAFFGGVGYLVRNSLGWLTPIALMVGLVAGLAGAAAVIWFLRKVIAPSDKAMDPKDYELPGTLARVSSSIREGGTGEIVYEQQGYRQVSAARSVGGAAVARGVEVVIMETRAGIAYVQPWAELVPDGDEQSALAAMDAELRALDAVAPDIPSAGDPAGLERSDGRGQRSPLGVTDSGQVRGPDVDRVP